MKRSIPKRVEAWFALSPNIVLNFDAVVGGKRGCLDPAIVIGARSTGMVSCKPEMGNVFHEMAHMIDIDDHRVRMPGWGLKYGKWHNLPTRYSSGFYEMQTDDAIRREVRVMAIQAALSEHCGLDFNYVRWAELLSNGAIPNYFIWRNNLGIDFEQEHDGTAANVDAGIIRSMREALSIEDLWAEWVHKADVVDQQVQSVS